MSEISLLQSEEDKRRQSRNVEVSYLLRKRPYCEHNPCCMGKTTHIVKTLRGEAHALCDRHFYDDICGNTTPDRIESNFDFWKWMEQCGDELTEPDCFEDWLNQSDDKIERATPGSVESH